MFKCNNLKTDKRGGEHFYLHNISGIRRRHLNNIICIRCFYKANYFTCSLEIDLLSGMICVQLYNCTVHNELLNP